MSSIRRGLAIAIMGFMLLGPLDVWSQSKNAPQDAKSLQRELAKKRKELNNVAANRRKLDTQRGAAAKQLRSVDEKVGETARALAVTQQRIAVESQALTGLTTKQQAMRLTLGDKEAERRELLKAAYRQNRAGPLKAFLSQDKVSGSSRTLRYHRYLQQDRGARIQTLNAELSSLDAVQKQIRFRQSNLTAFQRAQQGQAIQLQKDRAQRDHVVRQLNTKFTDARTREKALGKDVAGLDRLLGQLRAAAVRAERERKAIAAARAKQAASERAAARKAEAAASAAKTSSTPKQVPNAATIRSSVRSTEKPVGTPVASAPVTPARKPQVLTPRPAVASIGGPSVGGMGWPASGTLLAGFGAQMPDGRRSNGLLIGAAAGSPVRAVSAGDVVYAQWMTGYGQLIIIDHGGGRMSLYAYNEALLKRVGDRVGRGDTIGTVGNSGGHGRPAVYFELRSNGAAVNPRSMLN